MFNLLSRFATLYHLVSGGNSVNLNSGIIRLHTGWNRPVCIGNRCQIVFVPIDIDASLLVLMMDSVI